MIGGESMPTLSEFYGIKITMNWNDYGAHKVPHIHAKFNEFEASFGFDGQMLVGEMPPKQTKLIEAWIEIHLEELEANWERATNNVELEKINPLQ